MRKALLNLSIIFSLLLCSTVAFAEHTEWKDATYDFTKIKTVYVEPEIVYAPECTVSELDLYKNLVTLDENMKKLKNFQVVNDVSLADAIVTVNVTAWNVSEKYIEPEEYTLQEYAEHVDTDGNVTYEPVTLEVYSDGYYEYEQYFTAEFLVTDKAGKLIYKRTENRQADKDTFAMFGRAIKDFYDDFNDINDN